MAPNITSLGSYRVSRPKQETRTAWGNFPSVHLSAPIGTAKKHPYYEDAKMKGSLEKAYHLVKDIVPADGIEEIRLMLGDAKPLIVPVHAMEKTGVNKLPLAFAGWLGHNLGLDVCLDIVQSNKPQRTDKKAFYRLSQHPTFDGNVLENQDYLIVDDTLCMGGTIASLRGHIENRGGRVARAACLTGHEGAATLPIKQSMLDTIHTKHGEDLNEWWKIEIGFGIDKLTQGEAGHLRKARSFEQIRSRILEERPS